MSRTLHFEDPIKNSSKARNRLLTSNGVTDSQLEW